MSARAKILGGAAVLALAAVAYTAPASAVPVSCKDPSQNYMKVDNSYVSACLDAGIGNIGQAGKNDDFLTGGFGGGWTKVGEGDWEQLSKSKFQSTGSFELDSSLWDSYLSLAIGFKFGTGGYPDQWFVYQLNHLVSSGFWNFLNTYRQGGGLSHVTIYGGERDTHVPEPATLTLLGLGLLGIGFARRKKA